VEDRQRVRQRAARDERAVLEIALYEYGENPIQAHRLLRDLGLRLPSGSSPSAVHGGVERCGE